MKRNHQGKPVRELIRSGKRKAAAKKKLWFYTEAQGDDISLEEIGYGTVCVKHSINQLSLAESKSVIKEASRRLLSWG